VSSNDPIPFQASVSTVDEGDWLTAEPASGVTSTQNTQVLTVRADARNLSPGIYTGDVNVAFSNREVRTTNITLVVPPRNRVQAAKAGRFLEGCTPTALSLTQTGSVNSFGAAVGWPLPLIVRLADDCGEPVLGAQMIATFSNGDPALPMKLTNPQVGLYSTTWVPGRPGSQVRVTARATAPNLDTAAADIIGKVEPNRPPVLLKNATLSNLNPVAGAPLAPGAVAQIFGTDLAPAAASAPSVPLPANLNGVTVLIGGYQAPIFFVSPGQINVQVPFELDVNQEHSMVVAGNGGVTIPDSISLTAVRPGLYSADGRAVALHADGTFVTGTSPARPDEEITIHLEAMGRTNPAVGSGAPSPPDPPSEPVTRPTVVLNDEEAPLVWSRLAPGSVGLYQIRFKVPSGAREGGLPVWVKQADAISNVALLHVSR
jgi:adhesin/invasin